MTTIPEDDRRNYYNENRTLAGNHNSFSLSLDEAFHETLKVRFLLGRLGKWIVGRGLYTGNRGVCLHWVALDCYFCRRSYDDFSNPGCKCLSIVILWAWVEILHAISWFNSLETGLTISS